MVFAWLVFAWLAWFAVKSRLFFAIFELSAVWNFGTWNLELGTWLTYLQQPIEPSTTEPARFAPIIQELEESIRGCHNRRERVPLQRRERISPLHLILGRHGSGPFEQVSIGGWGHMD